MDKKQFTSWGVSFGSLALVAGMVSYLGLNTPAKANKNTNTTGQVPAASQNTDQQQQQFGDDQTQQQFGDDGQQQFGDDGGSQASGGDDGSQNNTSMFDNGGGQQQNTNPFSGGGGGGFSRHQRGFNTTTGGS